jgi:transposase
MKTIRQCVGIDCSKDTLDVAISFLKEDFNAEVQATEVFKNNDQGFKRLMKWVKKLYVQELPCQMVVEATGVYHECLAYALVKNNMEVAVVLPNKVRNYCRSTDVRTITDKISAKQIAEFGLGKKLDNWTPPDKMFRQLRTLCRERSQLLHEKTSISNQKHAYDYSAFPYEGTEKRSKRRTKFLENQITEIEDEIRTILDAHPAIKEKVEKIGSIKGVGWLTVVTVVAETNGFNLIRNCRQLVCYAGYDIVVKDSGTSVRSKPRMSHKGNKHIRAALHFPALIAVRYNDTIKAFYKRLFERQKVKMKSYVAVQRKLLTLIYTLWKKDEYYDPAYHNKQSNNHKILEQPIEVALTEVDHVPSCDCVNLNAKIKNNFQLNHKINKT